MRVKVLRKFSDKYTGEIYNKGDVLTVTRERYDEIRRVGPYVFEIPDFTAVNVASDDTVNNADAEEKPVTSNSAPSDDGFESMTVRQLKEYADKAYKLTFATGTKKAEIIETLRRMERGCK